MKRNSQKQLATWSMASLWNDSFRLIPPKEIVPRNYIYASELGGSFIDRYYKMMGEKPTNPPNFRSLRKFEAGNFFEFILQFVLTRSGLLKNSQERVKFALPKCLEVSGRVDFIAGGLVDYEAAKDAINVSGLPEHFTFVAASVMEYLKEKYGNQLLQKYIVECKSAATITFDTIERKKTPINTHQLQLFHYVKGSDYVKMIEDIKLGKIFYICKDDLRLQEFDIQKDDKTLLQTYTKDIETMTYYYNNKELPPKCDEIIFDEGSFNFRINLQVEWSNYLTKVYGYETPEQFRKTWIKQVSSFNRTFKRCVNGDKMTTLNLETIKEAKNIFPNWDDLVSLALQNKEFIQEDETEN